MESITATYYSLMPFLSESFYISAHLKTATLWISLKCWYYESHYDPLRVKPLSFNQWRLN